MRFDKEQLLVVVAAASEAYTKSKNFAVHAAESSREIEREIRRLGLADYFSGKRLTYNFSTSFMQVERSIALLETSRPAKPTIGSFRSLFDVVGSIAWLAVLFAVIGSGDDEWRFLAAMLFLLKSRDGRPRATSIAHFNVASLPTTSLPSLSHRTVEHLDRILSGCDSSPHRLRISC